MELLEIALGAFTLLLVLGSLGGSLLLISLARKFRAETQRRMAALSVAFTPPAALHVPTRGDFKDLEPNLRALLAQDYPNLQVVVTVDERAGPLFAACEALAKQVAPGRATVVAVDDAPVTAKASGKCAAQLRGLAAISPEAQVLVFADDDVRPDPQWVTRLIRALADPAVGVATAYRWYFSGRGNLASNIRSAWNLVGLQIMYADKWNFAWGGGMALRRRDFVAWKIAEGWERAVSDDYVVTIAAKREKQPIRFVPSTIAPSREQVDGSGMLEWCRRQTFMTRIYDPGLWKYAITPYLFFNGLLVLGIGLFVAGAVGVPLPRWAWLAAAAFVLHVPLNLAKAAIFYAAVCDMLPAYKAELATLRGGYLAGAALAPFVTIYALLKSRKLTLIEWRGRKYEVHGPMDVRPL